MLLDNFRHTDLKRTFFVVVEKDPKYTCANKQVKIVYQDLSRSIRKNLKMVGNTGYLFFMAAVQLTIQSKSF